MTDVISEKFSFNTLFGINHDKEYRKCNCCGEWKRLSEFPQRSSISSKYGGYDVICKKCQGKEKALRTKLRKENKHLFKGVCDIQAGCCSGKDVLAFKDAIMEHNHKTKKFRGWACQNCNTALGRAGDDKEGVNKLKEYLDRTDG